MRQKKISETTIKTGFPQGSVSGQLIYINDISDVCAEVKIIVTVDAKMKESARVLKTITRFVASRGVSVVIIYDNS